MDIMLHVGQDGRIALTCDGVFDSLIEAVELNFQSAQLSLKFADVEEPVALNCPVDMECIETMMDQKTCTIGFILGRQLAGAVYVPFHINFFGQLENEDFTEKRMVQ